MKTIYLVPFIIFSILGVALFKGLHNDPHKLPSPLMNKPLPAFTTTSLLDSHKTFNSKDLRGQVSLLNVWATWCASCKLEHRLLMAISKAHMIPLYGLDYKDDRQQATALLKQIGNPYELNAFDNNGQAAIELGVYGTPETFIIDTNGLVRYKHIGPITLQDWQYTLFPLIVRLRHEAHS